MSQNSPSNWDSIRQEVYQRDEYRCQNCESRGGPDSEIELHAHYAVPLSQGGLNNTSNLHTLCKRCHNAAHSRGQAAIGDKEGKSIDRQAVEQVGRDLGECESCGSNEFGYEADDMVKCMNCDWVYQLETPYISDAVTKTFRICPGWFCTNSDMEYKPFYFSEGKPGRMRCNRCRKTWKVDPKAGTYERYTPSTRTRENLTIESDGRAWQGHRDLREGLLDVWRHLMSRRS